MDEDARKRFLSMKARADQKMEQRAAQQKYDLFQKTMRVRSAVAQAATDNLIDNLERGKPLLPVSQIKGRPGERLVTGQARRLKPKKSPSYGPSL